MKNTLIPLKGIVNEVLAVIMEEYSRSFMDGHDRGW